MYHNLKNNTDAKDQDLAQARFRKNDRHIQNYWENSVCLRYQDQLKFGNYYESSRLRDVIQV